MTSEDTARAVLAHLQATVDTRDLVRMTDLFAPDAVLVGTSRYNRGAEEIRDYLSAVASQEESLFWDLPRLDVLLDEGDVVAFAGSGHIVVTLGEAEERLPFRLTLVAERAGDDWRIRHFHGSLPDTD